MIIRRNRQVTGILALLVALATGPSLRAAPRAELLSSVTAVRPGEAFQVGIHLELEEGWHSYWVNPGDAGAPARLRWHLPEGCSAGPIQWPAPERYVDGDIVSFGYVSNVTLLVTVQTTTNLAAAAAMRLRADLSVLVCKEACVPHDLSVVVPVRLADVTVPADEAQLKRLREAAERLPIQDVRWRFATMQVGPDRWLYVERPVGVDVATLQTAAFFPLKPGQLDLKEAGVWTTRDGMDALQLRAAPGSDPRAPLDGVLLWPASARGVPPALVVQALPP